MAEPSKSQRDAATRLLMLLRRPEDAGETQDEAAVAGRVLDVLFTSLGPIIGVAGVAAVFARSLKLSRTACPSFGNLLLDGIERLPPEPEQVSQRLVECLRELEPAIARESATSLFATFLRLLRNFVGEELLWQIVRGALPTGAEFEVEETQ